MITIAILVTKGISPILSRWKASMATIHHNPANATIWTTVTQSGLMTVSHFDLKVSWLEVTIQIREYVQSKTLFNGNHHEKKMWMLCE
jgi:hypothetical protein